MQKSKPFNLDRAKAGNICQLSDGRKAYYRFTLLRRDNPKVSGKHVFEVENSEANWIYVFDDYGSHTPATCDKKNIGQLYMAPIKKEYWIAVGVGAYDETKIYSSQIKENVEDAINTIHHNHNVKDVTTHKIIREE
jgi:hypothetical protein